MASISGGLTLGLGGILLWMFFTGIVIPLRGMVADAQLLHGSRLPSLNRSEEDEMRTVGTYLRSLLSDVADTRSSLERSRGRLLAAACFDAARRAGCTRILTEIRADNDASLRFYLRLGFEIVGVAHDLARLGGRFVDVVIVEKDI